MNIEDKFKKLEEVDILDIYDEMAELPIPNQKVIDMCIKIPCKIDLRRCNLVYLVEQKYKNKLANYNQKKVLKWLNRNLPRLFSKPEDEYLRCHESLERRAKIEFIERKSQALAQLPSRVCDSSADSDRDECVVSGTNRECMEEIIPGFLGLLDVSASSIESTELPTVCSNSISSSQVIEGEPAASPVTRLPLSEGFSSEDDSYSTFDFDNVVTSTQEFG